MSEEKNEIAGVEFAMKDAKTAVVAIFNRFGDGVIGGVVCEEFFRAWLDSGCRFLVVTSPQLYPYLKEICPSAEIIPLARKNPFHWARLLFKRFFQYGGFDVGLNPYSYSKESKRIARMAKWHKIYKNPEQSFFVNYYDRVRYYFGLQSRGEFGAKVILPESPQKILLCPESSESRRSLTEDQVRALLVQTSDRWPEAKITLAVSERFFAPQKFDVENTFFLKKSERCSLDFIGIMRDADLVITVDSGPMHIAGALRIPVLALFSSAHPATVINHDAKVTALRTNSLRDIYCEVLDCKTPRCMDDLNIAVFWDSSRLSNQRSVSHERCPYDAI